MAWLNPAFIGSLTPGTVLLILVLLIATGRLRPKSNVTEIREDRDARLADAQAQRDEWREAYFLSEEARKQSETAFREALEVVRTANAVLSGFREAVHQVAIEANDRREGSKE